MRLWSLHPRYLDPQGLVALWREGLLARSVLTGQTRGYRSHPQLQRFRSAPDPVAAIDAYLFHVWREATRRGYRFRPWPAPPPLSLLSVTSGQLAFELAHLRRKLERRAPGWALGLPDAPPEAHPLFRVVPGPVEPWERTSSSRRAVDAPPRGDQA